MYWVDEPGRYNVTGVRIIHRFNFLLNSVRWLLVGKIHESDAFTVRDSATPFITLYSRRIRAISCLSST